MKVTQDCNHGDDLNLLSREPCSWRGLQINIRNFLLHVFFRVFFGK